MSPNSTGSVGGVACCKLPNPEPNTDTNAPGATGICGTKLAAFRIAPGTTHTSGIAAAARQGSLRHVRLSWVSNFDPDSKKAVIAMLTGEPTFPPRGCQVPGPVSVLYINQVEHRIAVSKRHCDGAPVGLRVTGILQLFSTVTAIEVGWLRLAVKLCCALVG